MAVIDQHNAFLEHTEAAQRHYWRAIDLVRNGKSKEGKTATAAGDKEMAEARRIFKEMKAKK